MSSVEPTPPSSPLAGCSGFVGSIVVLSPHLDDAVLSLGGVFARLDTARTAVTVVTVLAGDPTLDSPAGGWDRDCGFQSAAEAFSQRREEDRRACSLLGLSPIWLPFNDEQYERGGNDDEVWAALAAHLSRQDLLLLPGFPLEHPDHAWLTELVLGRVSPQLEIGFYTEQPYANWKGINPTVGTAQKPVLGRPVRWNREAVGLRQRRRKGKACRAYRSQVRGFRRRLPLRVTRALLLPETSTVQEIIGWPQRPASAS